MMGGSAERAGRGRTFVRQHPLFVEHAESVAGFFCDLAINRAFFVAFHPSIVCMLCCQDGVLGEWRMETLIGDRERDVQITMKHELFYPQLPIVS